MSKNNLKLAIEIENKVSNLGEAEQYINSLKQMGINTDHLRERSDQLSKAWDDLNPAQRPQRGRSKFCVSEYFTIRLYHLIVQEMNG